MCASSQSSFKKLNHFSVKLLGASNKSGLSNRMALETETVLILLRFSKFARIFRSYMRNMLVLNVVDKAEYKIRVQLK